MKRAKEEISSLRERWAVLTNDVLANARRKERVDHRMPEGQSIDRIRTHPQEVRWCIAIFDRK